MNSIRDFYFIIRNSKKFNLFFCFSIENAQDTRRADCGIGRRQWSTTTDRNGTSNSLYVAIQSYLSFLYFRKKKKKRKKVLDQQLNQYLKFVWSNLMKQRKFLLLNKSKMLLKISILFKFVEFFMYYLFNLNLFNLIRLKN